MNLKPDILKDTYIIYTADNGFHIGQHRIPPGKTCGIEEDINIPFFILGPGIEMGETITFPTSHTDIVPTIFTLAGIPLRNDFDGEPIPVTKELQRKITHRTEHVNIEFWGKPGMEGKFWATRMYLHTF